MNVKRTISFLIIAIMLTGVFAGCEVGKKSNGDGEKEPVKLVFWGALPPENGPQAAVDGYKTVAPHVTIEYVRYINDEQGNIKLDTALMAKEEIDVFTSYGVPARERRVAANMCADLTDLCKQYDIDLIRDFGPGAQANIVDGKVYSIPTMTIIYFIALNKNMFDNAGIPIPQQWSLEEFRDIARQLTSGVGQDKVYGIIGDQNVNILNFMPTKIGKDPSYLDDSLTATTWTDNPDFRKAFKLLYDMMYVDESMMPWEDVITQKLTNTEALAAAFFGGRSAMMVTGTYMLRTIKDAEKYPRDFMVAFAPIPSVDKNQDVYYKRQVPHDDMMVPPASQKKDEAVKFIKWYATEGFDTFIKNGRPPLYTEYDKELSANLLLEGGEGLVDFESFIQNVLTPAEHVANQISVTQAAELDTIFREEQEAYYLNEIDLDTLLNNLKKRHDEILKAK